VIQSFTIREQGLVLYGPDPKTFIAPISPEDLKKAQLATLRSWWTAQIENPFRLLNSDYQAYAVLTMCRALYTLHFGRLTSKAAAASWAQTELGERWSALIQQSRILRGAECVEHMGEVLDFIQYTLNCANSLNDPSVVLPCNLLHPT
jgi:hypothetical protein